MGSNSSWRKAYYILTVIVCVFLLQPKGGTWAWLENVRWLYVLLLSFSLTQLLTPIVIKLAFHFKILDYPDSSRKLHAKPIPRIGGLGIFIAVMATILRNFQFSMPLIGLVIGSSIIYIVGFIDDVRPLPATARLFVQILASVVVVAFGTSVSVVPVGVPYFRFFDGMVTVIWLIGIANAINFLDGIDGLATSMIALSSLLFFMIAWPTRQNHLTFFTCALAGGCLGFLPFNWKSASIFLGDSGATFLGFVIAGFAVMGTWAHNNATVALSTPLLILGIPIFDMIYTTISRIKKGYVKTFKEWLEYAGRDHFHHRLANLGFSDVGTVLFILMVNFCLGLGALVMRDTGTKGSVLMLTQSVIIFLIIVLLMVVGKNPSEVKPNHAVKTESK